jgi:signal peptidase
VKSPAYDRAGVAVIRWVAEVAGWAVILASSAALLLAVVLPRAAGATPYAVQTGSMRPSYPPGSLLVVRPSAPEDIAIGNVVTYQLRSGEPAVVSHRVSAVNVNTVTREYAFTTKGDANDEADLALVRPPQVRGTLWYAVPYLGHLQRALSGSEHALFVHVAAGALAAYAAVLLGTAAVGRWARRPRGEHHA